MKPRYVAYAAVATLVGLAVSIAGPTAARRIGGSGGDARGHRALRWAWPAGERFVYSFRHHGSNHARLGDSGGNLDGAFDLAGSVALRSFGERDGATLVGLSVESLDKYDVTLAEHGVGGVAAARRELAGREAFLEVLPNGAVRASWFDADAGDSFRHFVGALVRDGRMTIEPLATSWQTRERTATGEVESNYHRLDGDDDVVERQRGRYATLALFGDRPCADCEQRLASRARARFDRAGWPASLDATESIVIARAGAAPMAESDVTLQLTLTSHARFAAAAPDLALLRKAPADDAESDDERAQLMAQRIGSMSLPQLLYTTAAYGDGRTLPGDFVWRASGLLLEHPELVADLRRQFERATTKVRTRALLLDVLASAGSPEAQAAMRQMLASTAATAEHGAYVSLVQRLSFVARPDRQTAQFVAELYGAAARRGDRGAEMAAAHTLGAVVGSLERAGEHELAAEYARRLRDDLAAAAAAADRAELVAALGNAHRDEDATLLVGYTHDADAGVRAQALHALRQLASPEARAALLQGLSDRDLEVQRAALGTLDGGRVAPSDVGVVVERVMSGTLGGDLDPALVTFLAARARGGVDVRGALHAIAARTHDANLADRVRIVLLQLES